MASARTRVCRVAIRVRIREQRPAQRAEENCSRLPRDSIELANTNRVRSGDNDRARQRIAVKADRISSSGKRKREKSHTYALEVLWGMLSR